VAVLRGAARAMRDSSAILSVIVRNQAGEVLKAAIQAGDLAAAEQTLPLSGDMSLCTEQGASVYGRKPASHVDGSVARVTAKRGLRVVSDYLPPRVSLSAEYDRIFELELKLGRPTGVCRSRPLHSMPGTLRRSGDGGWRMNDVAIHSSSATSHVVPPDGGISLGLGLTNECNLSCDFCYRDPTRADRLSLDQVKAVMERLPVRS